MRQEPKWTHEECVLYESARGCIQSLMAFRSSVDRARAAKASARCRGHRSLGGGDQDLCR